MSWDGRATGASGHQLAVVAYRDGQLYCTCTGQRRGSRGEEEEEEEEAEEEEEEGEGEGEEGDDEDGPTLLSIYRKTLEGTCFLTFLFFN